MNIAFFSSSSFTLPILHSVIDNQGKSFYSLVADQLQQLDSDSSIISERSRCIIIDNRQVLDTIINLKLVVSQPDTLNRSKVVSNPITTFATLNNLPHLTGENINQVIATQLDDVDIAITASFGQFVSSKTLLKTKYGFINWHPSLLPKYRGATPLQSALINCDEIVGLSWINMTKAMDAGNIYLQFPHNVETQDTFGSLINYFGEVGSQTWAIAVALKILNIGLVQDESQVIECSKLSKDDRLVDPIIQSAREIFGHYQGCFVFPSTCIIDDYFAGEIKIMDCRPFAQDTSGFQSHGNWLLGRVAKQQIAVLKCANNSYLQVSKIKLSTGKNIDLSGFGF